MTQNGGEGSFSPSAKAATMKLLLFFFSPPVSAPKKATSSLLPCFLFFFLPDGETPLSALLRSQGGRRLVSSFFFYLSNLRMCCSPFAFSFHPSLAAVSAKGDSFFGESIVRFLSSFPSRQISQHLSPLCGAFSSLSSPFAPLLYRSIEGFFFFFRFRRGDLRSIPSFFPSPLLSS